MGVIPLQWRGRISLPSFNETKVRQFTLLMAMKLLNLVHGEDGPGWKLAFFFSFWWGRTECYARAPSLLCYVRTSHTHQQPSVPKFRCKFCSLHLNSLTPTLRLCVTIRSRDLQNILISGVKGTLIKTLAHTVTPSLPHASKVHARENGINHNYLTTQQLSFVDFTT